MRLQTVPVSSYGKLAYLGTKKLHTGEYNHLFIFFLEEPKTQDDFPDILDEFCVKWHCRTRNSKGMRMVILTHTKEDLRRPQRYMRGIAGRIASIIKRNALTDDMEWLDDLMESDDDFITESNME